jgi:membrane protein YdbS with pleckstrin-like domain
MFNFFRPSRRAYILHYLFWAMILIAGVILLLNAFEGRSGGYFIFWKFMEYAAYIILSISVISILIMEYRILSRRYALTSERILYSRGIFQEVFKSLSYSYITDIEYFQTFWDKIMNTGTLAVNTSGSQEYEIRYRKISDPLKVKKMINNLQTQKTESGVQPQIHKAIIREDTEKKSTKKRR